MSVFKRRSYACQSCGHQTTAFAWDYDPAPQHHPHGPMVEVGYERAIAPGVIDDQLEGGPRRFENLPGEPFLSTKSEWNRAVADAEARHGIVHVVRHEASYYAKQRKMHDERLRDTGQLVTQPRVR